MARWWALMTVMLVGGELPAQGQFLEIKIVLPSSSGDGIFREKVERGEIHTKTVSYTAMVNGKESILTKKMAFQTSRVVRDFTAFKDVQFYTPRGRKLSKEKVLYIMAGQPTPVIFLPPGQKKLDPVYLKILKEGALVAAWKKQEPPTASERAQDFCDWFVDPLLETFPARAFQRISELSLTGSQLKSRSVIFSY